jgi:hypothetical protein
VVSDKVILNEVIAKVMMLGGYVCQALKECQIEKYDDLDHPECYINFFASDVKWYPDFEDVKGHHALMENIVDWYPEGSAYYFLRIGEESDDVDEQHDGDDDFLDYVWDGMHVVRSLELPFSHCYKPIGDELRIFDTSSKV